MLNPTAIFITNTSSYIHNVLTSRYDMVTLYFISSLVFSMETNRSFNVRAMIPGSSSVPNIVYVLPAPEERMIKWILCVLVLAVKSKQFTYQTWWSNSFHICKKRFRVGFLSRYIFGFSIKPIFRPYSLNILIWISWRQPIYRCMEILRCLPK